MNILSLTFDSQQTNKQTRVKFFLTYSVLLFSLGAGSGIIANCVSRKLRKTLRRTRRQ